MRELHCRIVRLNPQPVTGNSISPLIILFFCPVQRPIRLPLQVIYVQAR
jgi:hypothetical protein